MNAAKHFGLVSLVLASGLAGCRTICACEPPPPPVSEIPEQPYELIGTYNQNDCGIKDSVFSSLGGFDFVIEPLEDGTRILGFNDLPVAAARSEDGNSIHLANVVVPVDSLVVYVSADWTFLDRTMDQFLGTTEFDVRTASGSHACLVTYATNGVLQQLSDPPTAPASADALARPARAYQPSAPSGFSWFPWGMTGNLSKTFSQGSINQVVECQILDPGEMDLPEPQAEARNVNPSAVEYDWMAFQVYVLYAPDPNTAAQVRGQTLLGRLPAQNIYSWSHWYWSRRNDLGSGFTSSGSLTYDGRAWVRQDYQGTWSYPLGVDEHRISLRNSGYYFVVYLFYWKNRPGYPASYQYSDRPAQAYALVTMDSDNGIGPFCYRQ